MYRMELLQFVVEYMVTIAQEHHLANSVNIVVKGG